ncbi:BspA family leucine-rich repeat surface protein [Vibrio harveyi]|nr:BspA family leucine-rich repeat surface protein [Vibrio harveyi]
MGQMFRGAKKFNKPLKDWNTSQITDMNEMFREASVFNQDLTN